MRKDRVSMWKDMRKDTIPRFPRIPVATGSLGFLGCLGFLGFQIRLVHSYTADTSDIFSASRPEGSDTVVKVC